MPTVLITGANRGIGLSFVKAFQSQGYNVFGTTRSLANATDLKATGASVLELDLGSEHSIRSLAEKLGDTPLDLVINNAGVLTRTTSLEVTAEEMHTVFQTNAVAPLLVAQALLPNLRKASSPRVINITSRVGSIQDNTSGNYIAYRTSKTALNMINKTLSLDIPDVTFVALHPGHIQTSMTNGTGDMGPDEAVEKMMKVIAKVDKSYTGKFYHRDDYELPW